MNLIKKIVRHFSKGGARRTLYDVLFTQLLPQAVGQLWLYFYRLLYRNFSFGKDIHAWGRVIVGKTPGSMLRLGDHVRIMSDPTTASIAQYSRCKFQLYFHSKIIIGNNVGLNGTSITCRTTSIEIGDGTIIAPNVIIVDSDFHAIWPPENRMYNFAYDGDRPVKIGKNVWIAMNCLILKGVSIGDNSIIAAGSVVVADIPENVVAGGVPARVLRPLV